MQRNALIAIVAIVCVLAIGLGVLMVTVLKEDKPSGGTTAMQPPGGGPGGPGGGMRGGMGGGPAGGGGMGSSMPGGMGGGPGGGMPGGMGGGPGGGAGGGGLARVLEQVGASESDMERVQAFTEKRQELAQDLGTALRDLRETASGEEATDAQVGEALAAYEQKRDNVKKQLDDERAALTKDLDLANRPKLAAGLMAMGVLDNGMPTGGFGRGGRRPGGGGQGGGQPGGRPGGGQPGGGGSGGAGGAAQRPQPPGPAPAGS